MIPSPARPVQPAEHPSWKYPPLCLSGEDMDGAGTVIEAGDSSPGHVREADFSAVNLSRSGSTFDLAHDLDHLRRARRSDRMPFGQKAAARIDRDTATQRRVAVGEQPWRVACFAEA